MQRVKKQAYPEILSKPEKHNVNESLIYSNVTHDR